MEKKELKSEYPYFILTNPELIIENISSSAINLGLTLDLLKKYVVKMDVLIRTENNHALNIYENYTNFEEESENVVWVFPDIIYPKDNNKQNKEENIEDLIKKSTKKEFKMQINTIMLNNNLAFLFKLTEINLKFNKDKLNTKVFIPKCDKNLIMFDLLNLNYIRTFLVNKKSGFRNLRNREENNNEEIIKTGKKFENKKIKIRKQSISIEEGKESDDLEKNKNINLLTNEKIMELQGNNYSEIKEFIFSLPIYGRDIALERFRPNGEKYSASKITESLIKIHINNFCKSLDGIAHLALKKNTRVSKNISINSNSNPLESPNSSNTNNNLFHSTHSSSLELNENNFDFEKKEINKGLTSDSSSLLSNYFKTNSISNIRLIIGFMVIETLLFLLIEFIITYSQINKLKNKIYSLYNSYKILNYMLYTKYYITEGVIGNTLNLKYFPVNANRGLSFFLKNIQYELAQTREEFTETYDTFSLNELCEEYKNYMKNTTINIFTLSLNHTEIIPILFNTAMTRITSGINNLVSDTSLLIMNNRDSYELMHNLINEYYKNWGNIITILYNDAIKATNLKLALMAIIFTYFFISIIIIILFLKLLSQFYLDREKPINLFLTIKKEVFENLKNSAENFSNKLLNKFFGNEESEEDSQRGYQTYNQPNDINIIKFKAANENNYSIKKAFYFAFVIIIIVTFILIYIIYFIAKYYSFSVKMNSINHFIIIFDKTNAAQNDYILSFDIFKSYLFNKSIPILNNKETKNEFISNFLKLSEKYEDSIKINSKSSSFLSKKYLQKYGQYLNGDFKELLDEEFVEKHSNLIETSKNGLNPSQTRFFEIIRYYTINYCIYSKSSDYEKEDMSDILKEQEFKIYEINVLIELIMKIWYKNIIKMMIGFFDEYLNNSNINYIIAFICSIVVSILYYFIIWRIFQQRLNSLLKGSYDLINLIPQEIKELIIEKLNE